MAWLEGEDVGSRPLWNAGLRLPEVRPTELEELLPELSRRRGASRTSRRAPRRELEPIWPGKGRPSRPDVGGRAVSPLTGNEARVSSCGPPNSERAWCLLTELDGLSYAVSARWLSSSLEVPPGEPDRRQMLAAARYLRSLGKTAVFVGDEDRQGFTQGGVDPGVQRAEPWFVPR